MYLEIKLKPDCYIKKLNENILSLQLGKINFTLDVPNKHHQDILLKLEQGVLEQDLEPTYIEDKENFIQNFISKLKMNCCLVYCIYSFRRNNLLYSVVPRNFYEPILDDAIRSLQIESETLFEFSKFSYFRFENEEIILDNPLSPAKIVFQNIELLNIILKFKKPNFLSVNSHALKISLPLYSLLIDSLIKCKFIVKKEMNQKNFSKLWEFHDLLFHKHSRMQEFPYPQNFGASFPYLEDNKFPPFKEPMNSSKIEISKNTFDTIYNVQLLDILRKRKTRRCQNIDPISKEKLDELLYHVFNAKFTTNNDNESFIRRTYPNAGGLNELEVYVIVNECKGLKKDIYHFHPIDLGLYPLNASMEYINESIKLATYAWGNTKNSPQILLIITSKFPRIYWKYEGIGYRNTLVNAGAAMQTVYLVAEALNLAACCLGYGCSELFSKAIKVNPLEESSILEIAIGSRIENDNENENE